MKIFMLAVIDTRVSDASIIHFGEIANSLHKLGHEVSLLLPKASSANQVINKEIKIYEMPFYYRESILNAFLVGIWQIFWVLINKPDCEVFLLRWRLLPIGLFKSGYLFKAKKPIFITEHNGWIELEMQVQKRNLAIIGKYLQVFDARFADRVVVVTEGIKQMLITNGLSKNKLFVIDNGTNTAKFYPLVDRVLLKEQLLNTNLPVIGFIGNISRWQGLDDLIDNYIEIKKQMDFILVIIGSGIYKYELLKKVKTLNLSEEIIFIDNVSYSEINKYINLIDYAVAPKVKALNNIGYSPLKIRDYCACGKAVISTRVKGIQELEGQGWLWTYNPDEKGSFIKIVQEIYNNYNLKDIETNARKYAETYFSWDVAAQKIINTIDFEKQK